MMLCVVPVLADECEHFFRILYEDGRYDYGWFDKEARGHVWCDFYWQKCDYCGVLTMFCLEDLFEPHTYVVVDDWHLNSETVHHYEEQCRKCAYARHYTLECEDDMCLKYIEMQRRVEDQDEE